MTAIAQPQRIGDARRFLRRRPAAENVQPEQQERVDIRSSTAGPSSCSRCSGRTKFQDLVLAFFLGREDAAGETGLEWSPEDGAAPRDHFNVLVRNFEGVHGHIRRSYFARRCIAAAVLTCGDEIKVVLARDVPVLGTDPGHPAGAGPRLPWPGTGSSGTTAGCARG